MDVQKRINKLNNEDKPPEILKELQILYDEQVHLLDLIVDLGLVDNQTKERVYFPKKYRTLDNDLKLSEAIIKATMKSTTTNNTSTPENKSKEQILKEIEASAYHLLTHSNHTEDEILNMPYAKFRREIEYLCDPKGFMKIEIDEEEAKDQMLDFYKQNIEFAKKAEEKAKHRREEIK